MSGNRFSRSNIIKKYYVFSKESISYISENRTLHFSSQAQRIKKSTPGEFIILQETETSK